MNAAERFVAASRARDLGAAVRDLAPDVVMRNPATDDPVVGSEAVAAALWAVEAACDEFRHTHLLVDACSSREPWPPVRELSRDLAEEDGPVGRGE